MHPVHVKKTPKTAVSTPTPDLKCGPEDVSSPFGNPFAHFDLSQMNIWM